MSDGKRFSHCLILLCLLSVSRTHNSVVVPRLSLSLSLLYPLPECAGVSQALCEFFLRKMNDFDSPLDQQTQSVVEMGRRFLLLRSVFFRKGTQHNLIQHINTVCLILYHSYTLCLLTLLQIRSL